MTRSTRHVSSIKEKIVELIDKLFSFVNLIIMTSVEACFLYIFVKVHEQVDQYLNGSPGCPFTIAVAIMGYAFLLLNVVIVISFVAHQIFKTLKSLRSSFSKNRRKARTNPTPNHAREAFAHSFTISRSARANVTITGTLVDESARINVPSARLPLSEGRA